MRGLLGLIVTAMLTTPALADSTLPPCPEPRREGGLIVEAVPLGGFACAREQARFREILGRYSRAYSAERNPVRATELRSARAREICEALVSKHVRDWRGTLIDMVRLPNGNIVVLLGIGPGTTTNRLRSSEAQGSPLGQQTQLAPESDAYRAIAELRPGQRVVFGGHFVPARDDCVAGARQTEVQMMIGPEFFFRVTEIRADLDR